MKRKRNPLQKGYSRETVSANISREIKRGTPQRNAVAMALRAARMAWRSRFPKGPFPAHLKLTMKTLARKANPSRKRIASIRHNDPRVTRRVSLYIRRKGKGFGIYTGSGEDAGQYVFTSKQKAEDAISQMWRGSEWDLQWENPNGAKGRRTSARNLQLIYSGDVPALQHQGGGWYSLAYWSPTRKKWNQANEIGSVKTIRAYMRSHGIRKAVFLR